ncbi:MAG: D-serine ammonia-lyase [Aerococcus sp.]|nr:D-serine ammonia-lyase [Aerococcus sp.]
MSEVDVQKYIDSNPVIQEITDLKPVFWINDKKGKFQEVKDKVPYNYLDVKDAEERLDRFRPFIKANFEDTVDLDGLIESPITKIENFKADEAERYALDIPGTLYLKRDDLLPISATIKARGAIYEVLVHAETVALENGLLSGFNDDYAKFSSKEFQDFFSKMKVVVATTGNLGISVGVMAAKLGFTAIVHMSTEAKQWKKDYLRSNGVNVIEHDTNFTEAVAAGRKAAEEDPDSYFVDDENSKYLFLGYTTAASRLKKQLAKENITVDDDHPLFVYLPCGVGGSPGGITFGLKHAFGDNVHAFFAEPTHVPSMLLALLTEEYSNVSVYDFGIDGKTVMDGLAVPRTSNFVSIVMENFFNGGYTLTDEESTKALTRLVDTEDIPLEPAAVAGLVGPAKLFGSEAGKKYLQETGINAKAENITHIAWATGGSMVPDADKKAFYELGVE